MMLSIDSQINSELKAIGMGQETFSQLSGISRSLLGAALRGTTPLSNDNARHAWSVVLELRELKRRAGDYPIDFSNFPAIKALLAKLREEKDNPPPLPNAEDLELLTDPDLYGSLKSAAEARGISQEELLGKVKEANRRIGFVLDKVSAIA